MKFYNFDDGQLWSNIHIEDSYSWQISINLMHSINILKYFIIYSHYSFYHLILII